MILVIGGTGTTGHALLQRLAALGVPARALVRPAGPFGPVPAAPDPVTPPRPRPDLTRLPGVEPVPGDVDDPAALATALEGVSRVFLAMGNGPRQLDRELAVVRAAATAGVDRLVKVSAPVVGPDVPVAVARVHHAVERAVVGTGLGHTFLRPYAFQQNLLASAGRIAATGSFTGTSGDTPMNMVDVRDVADVAAVALTDARPHGEALVLTGPEAVSLPEVARRLTRLGRPTRHRTVTAAAYRDELRGGGLPAWLVEHLVEIQALAVGRPERPDDTVERVTGRAARRLDDFLIEHLPLFGGPIVAPRPAA